jgi:hypothetical protein
MLVAAGGFLLAGCGKPDQRFVQASAVREARIHRILHDVEDREAEGPARLEKTKDYIEKSAQNDPVQLANTMAVIKKAHQRDVDMWPERLSRTRAYVEDQLDGDVESIDRTIPKMFY